jgi:hypothetical protein
MFFKGEGISPPFDLIDGIGSEGSKIGNELFKLILVGFIWWRISLEVGKSKVEMRKTFLSGLNGSKDALIVGSLFFDGFAGFKDEAIDIDFVDQGQNRVVDVEVGEFAAGEKVLKLL